MILIDSAEFNGSMQKNQLDLAAPVKAKVFLFNKDSVKPPKGLAKPKAVDGVAGFLHDQQFLPDESNVNSPEHVSWYRKNANRGHAQMCLGCGSADCTVLLFRMS